MEQSETIPVNYRLTTPFKEPVDHPATVSFMFPPDDVSFNS